ncbi:hypothetical protein QJS83_06290 [Bdellovibrio sp. 22V]|uniref:hypothetical protein n=1 Tax=Bdellovibrio TaxID=958 RepID=UPI002542AE9B|nr:hypothetical protein [Bdellovibrio sp. 22V]WII73478.1 hypothetical protein QJS83_06290 [Bdellovibrio sp. 22V]
MRLLAFFLVFMASFASFGADLKAEATLDFTNAYGGFNAGHYVVTAEFNAVQQPATAQLTRRQHRDDHDLYCVSTLTYDVGAMTLTLKNSLNGEVISRTLPLQATISKQDESEECTLTENDFAGDQVLYVSTTGRPYDLNVAPPKGWNKVQVWLSPFNTLTVKAKLTKTEKGLEIQPQTLFNDSLFATDSRNTLSMFYYLTAVESSGTLSLAVGTTPMHLTK